MVKLDLAEEKWKRKVINAADKWAEDLREYGFEDYVKSIAAVTGLPEDVVRNSEPARNFRDFIDNIDKYKEVYRAGVTTAAEEGKWKKGYLRAFGGR